MTGQTSAAEPTRIPMRIGATWREGESFAEVRDPYRGDVVAHMPVSTARDLDDALVAAQRGAAVMAKMPGYERAALLRRIADECDARAEAMGQAMARETGKALRDCMVETSRAGATMRLCAEEAVRIEGSHIPMDSSAMGAGKIAMMLRFPVGVVAAITPFNAPVNLAAHKLGPAIAAGNSVVLKPSPKAPLSVHLLVEAFIAAGVPDGAINAVYGDVVGPALVSDPRVDFVSFTGSIPVGRIIKQSMGIRRVALELGGVAPTFVHDDADIASAAVACTRNGLLLAGQSCVSVQNVFVARSRYDEFVELVRAEAATLTFGDPLDPTTDVGTLIDEQAACRVEAMVQRAESLGAQRVVGGDRAGALLPGTVLTGVDDRMDVLTDEVFGPVLSVTPYDDIEPIFERISQSPFGLQCGIYTNSLDLAIRAYKTIRTGGVILNGTSRWRSDQMPYGGVKDSGIGREGPRFAVQDMTEERLLVINH